MCIAAGFSGQMSSEVMSFDPPPEFRPPCFGGFGYIFGEFAQQFCCFPAILTLTEFAFVLIVFSIVHERVVMQADNPVWYRTTVGRDDFRAADDFLYLYQFCGSNRGSPATNPCWEEGGAKLEGVETRRVETFPRPGRRGRVQMQYTSLVTTPLIRYPDSWLSSQSVRRYPHPIEGPTTVLRIL